MKFQSIALAVLLSLSAAAHASGDHKGGHGSGEHGHAAKHGGIVVPSKQADLEIVVKPDVIQIYVDDHGKPVKLNEAKAKVTLLNGAEKSEIDLAPAGDKLEAKGTFKVAKGTKGIAVVTLAGKPATTARFEIK
ncbi:MAG: hypothetical protein ACKVIH_08795 [Burkholderiales bacterium]